MKLVDFTKKKEAEEKLLNSSKLRIQDGVSTRSLVRHLFLSNF